LEVEDLSLFKNEQYSIKYEQLFKKA